MTPQETSFNLEEIKPEMSLIGAAGATQHFTKKMH
jgi:hypothetical protein